MDIDTTRNTDLTQLPFEALPADDGRRLIDDYQIGYLGVGRDVLRFGTAASGQPAAALVAADPNFNLDAGQAHAQATSETAGAFQRGRVSREIQTGDLERLRRLPGTRVEGERIASMLGVMPLLGAEALEARIKACRSPHILHLATHGFFLADQRRDPNRELRGLGLLRRASRRWFWPNVRDAVGEDVGAWNGEPIAAFGGAAGRIQDLAQRRELAGGG